MCLNLPPFPRSPTQSHHHQFGLTVSFGKHYAELTEQNMSGHNKEVIEMRLSKVLMRTG